MDTVIYFLRFDRKLFQDEIVPALAAGWSRRSFEPCRPLCRSLLEAAVPFGDTCFIDPDGPLLGRVAEGLPFDRNVWRLLVAEVLLVAATDVPTIETAPEVLTCLLAPAQYQAGWVPREQLAPIQQVHFGSRDLRFGRAIYRPDRAGLNDAADTARLADYLSAIDPDRWQLGDLVELREIIDDAERADELDFVREWFPVLQNLYRVAVDGGQVVVCETL